MDAYNIRDFLVAVSDTLRAVKDSPLFDSITNDSSYYTMGDLDIGDDVIDPLGQIISGIDCMNRPETYSDHLTPDLQNSITALGERCFAILRADSTTQLSEDKAAAQETGDKKYG
jgi:hypothetical protein